jgi:ABC-type lipoprotein release transport system permease subunit
VRLALGAAPSRVVRLVVSEGLRLTAAGAAIGLAASAGAARLIHGLVVDAAPSDPRVLTAITILMLAIAAGAAYMPARRAALVDPIGVLRQE